MSRESLPIVAGKRVGAIGYGMMSLTRPWNPRPYEELTEVLKTALSQGVNFWNGGIHYGTPTSNSLHLLAHYFTTYPEDAEKVVLSIKGAYDASTHTPNGTPAAIRASVDHALSVLNGKKKIDIFEMARVDPNVPIEESMAALKELVEEGKIESIGLSEVSAQTIRRAQKIHPIAAVEVESSLFSLDILHNGVLDTCHELNIPIIAYSPISRGFLVPSLRKHSDLSPTDTRNFYPRFAPDVFDSNVKLVLAIEEIAKRKGASIPQTAIAWVRAQGAIPIPGASTIERVVENSKVVELTDSELEEIKGILAGFEVKGKRYPERFVKHLEG